MTTGYWNAPEETQAVSRNGWFHTGDVGFTHADGYIFLRDRKKDMIVSGGRMSIPWRWKTCSTKIL